MSENKDKRNDSTLVQPTLEDSVQQPDEGSDGHTPLPLDLNKEFWRQSSALQRIYKIALWNRITPSALLMGLLTQIAAITPPNVVLPPGLGAQRSINLYTCIAIISGGGKSDTITIPEEMLNLRQGLYHKARPASTAGFINMFLHSEDAPRGDGQKGLVRKVVADWNAALSVYDEMGELNGQMNNKASDVSYTYNTAWDGGEISRNISKDPTTRGLTLPRNFYRYCIFGAIQIMNAGTIFDHKDGLLQRFGWCSPMPYIVAPKLLDNPEWGTRTGETSFREGAGWTKLRTAVKTDISQTFDLARVYMGGMPEDLLLNITFPKKAYEDNRKWLDAKDHGKIPLEHSHDMQMREKYAAALSNLIDGWGTWTVTEKTWEASRLLMAESNRIKSLVAHWLDQENRLELSKRQALRDASRDSLPLAAQWVYKRVAKYQQEKKILGYRYLSDWYRGRCPQHESVSFDDALNRAVRNNLIAIEDAGTTKGAKTIRLTGTQQKQNDNRS